MTKVVQINCFADKSRNQHRFLKIGFLCQVDLVSINWGKCGSIRNVKWCNQSIDFFCCDATRVRRQHERKNKQIQVHYRKSAFRPLLCDVNETENFDDCVKWEEERAFVGGLRWGLAITFETFFTVCRIGFVVGHLSYRNFTFLCKWKFVKSS